MSDAVKLVKSLFPTARITSTKRSPSNPLSKANPRSYHIQGKAIDIAPIPGVKFKDYITSVKGAFKDAGLDIVEAIEEVGAKRSKHATGDHWHIAYSGGAKAPKAPEKANEELKMASAEVDMPEAPDFDVEAATEENFASLLAGLGKKKRAKKAKPIGILAGLI